MSETTEQIRAGLEQEPAINLHESRVDVIDGEEIRLVGRVGDIEAKRKALRVARERGGTPRIQDELRVDPGEPVPEDQLADRVEQTLGNDPDFRDIPVSRSADAQLSPDGHGLLVSVTDGVVRLEGQLPSLNHRRIAEVLTWWIPGVSDVDNRVGIHPPEEDNDGEIAEAVRLVIERDPALNADEINAKVDRAEVTLGGRAVSTEQAERARRDCWFLPGVREVHNQLEVRPG
jgi:osmotically-inducible protein OsmY